MSKYTTLVNILDQICKEAPDRFAKYKPKKDDLEKVNQARSRALIHLFLKVNFGLLKFEDRERVITDGSYDGGIDAYFIDQELKTTYLIQSKFRTNESNFEGKAIDINELGNMEIDRILEGELEDEAGNEYNGKIKQLIREVGDIPDIGKYKEKIIILANSPNCNSRAFKKLCNGFSPIVYDFEKVYNNLIFPVINGTYYNSSELAISLNLANKSSSGAKISYEVNTEFDTCDITVVFVPTIEIGRILNKYKNSILKFNPRCYLELNGNKVNEEILNTIKSKKTNEFALFNNGITMLSDSTSFNERIGQKDKAQICISNPQIINGGQTAHTLSKIYQEYLDGSESEDIFTDKEVLLKIITFNDDGNLSEHKKLKLIEDISKATNQQSEVDEADRRSNDEIQVLLQKKIFDDYGLYYERKKGEFSDGLHSKYITRNQLVQREKLIRISVALNKDPVNARRSGTKVLFTESNFKKYINSNTEHHSLIYALKVHDHLETLEKQSAKSNDRYNVEKFGQAFRYGKYSVVSVVCNLSISQKPISDCINDIDSDVLKVIEKWKSFEAISIKKEENSVYFKSTSYDGKDSKDMNFEGYYKGKTLNSDLINHWYE
jgi:hypothetical protein